MGSPACCCGLQTICLRSCRPLSVRCSPTATVQRCASLGLTPPLPNAYRRAVRRRRLQGKGVNGESEEGEAHNMGYSGTGAVSDADSIILPRCPRDHSRCVPSVLAWRGVDSDTAGLRLPCRCLVTYVSLTSCLVPCSVRRESSRDVRQSEGGLVARGRDVQWRRQRSEDVDCE